MSDFPAALESERALLGAMLVEDDFVYQLSDQLLPEDFYGEDNRKVFRTGITLAGQSKPVETITVIQNCKGVHPSYISDLTTGVPPKKFLEHHIKNVREKSNLRRLLNSLREVTNAIADGALTVDEAVSKAQQAVFSIEADVTESTIRSASICGTVELQSLPHAEVRA